MSFLFYAMQSLSRADSGMLDTLAVGDETEDDTVRTPVSSFVPVFMS